MEGPNRFIEEERSQQSVGGQPGSSRGRVLKSTPDGRSPGLESTCVCMHTCMSARTRAEGGQGEL